MIVRDDGDALHLITQPDHAALARRIMERWMPPPAARGESVFHAVAAHDDGWIELDDPLVIDAGGRIADFMAAPAADRRAVWPRAVAKLAADPWAAALVAQHAIHIYAHLRGDPAWHSFFDQMEELRSRWLLASDRPMDTLVEDYRWVRLGDLVSLTFCNRWAEPRESHGYSMRWDGHGVTITPDPFGGGDVAVEIDARRLPNRPFQDAAAAAAAWRHAGRVRLRGRVVGATAAASSPETES